MPVVLGYHGCDTEAAQELLGGSPFRESNKPYDWLGSGSYFWEGDIVRAHDWAVERRPQKPCVVGAVIDLGHCLDLTMQIGIQAVEQAYRSYIYLQTRAGKPIPFNKDAKDSKPGDLVLRLLDKAVIDHLHQSFKAASAREFDTVRALFPEGEYLYENAGFRKKTHVQIAVRKPDQILGVFRIPEHQLLKYSMSGIYDFQS